jgi:hypothetical protein
MMAIHSLPQEVDESLSCKNEAREAESKPSSRKQDRR